MKERPVTLIFVQWPVQYQGLVLTYCGANNRLMSYAFAQHIVAPDYLQKLVRDGWVDDDDYLVVRIKPPKRQKSKLHDEGRNHRNGRKGISREEAPSESRREAESDCSAASASRYERQRWR